MRSKTRPSVFALAVRAVSPDRRAGAINALLLQATPGLGQGQSTSKAEEYTRSSISRPTVTSGSARQLLVAPWDGGMTDQLPCATGTAAPALSYATHRTRSRR